MTKKRLAPYLAVGILAGLVLTACAGVTTGKIDLAAPGEVLTGGPAIDLQTLSFLEFAQPAHSAQFTFEKAEGIAPASLQSVIPAQSALESLTQTQTRFYGHGLCNGGAAGGD